MLYIYQIDDPEPLSEDLYSTVLKNGEASHSDLKYIFDVSLGIGSYTDHFTNLALRLRLIEEVVNDQYYILSDQTTDAIRQTDPGEQLFDILTRLPHFARWVQLTDSGGGNIDYEAVVPSGARKYKMRRGRAAQFEKWAENINDLADNTSFDALKADYKRREAYIWEEYISFDDIESDMDPVILLVLLGGAANVDASCNTNRLVDIIPCSRDEFDEIVDDVFTPVGIPLHRTSSCIGLNLSTELLVDDRTTLWSRVSDLFDDNIDISSLRDLTNHLRYETNILDFVEVPQRAPLRFKVVDGRQERDKHSRDENENHTANFDTIRPVEDAAFVAIPPPLSGVSTKDFFGRIEQVLEAAMDGQNTPDPQSRFEYHVRQQLYHCGSIPLLKAPNFETLTTDGRQYLQRNMADRRSLVFGHLLARNLPVRAIIAAADVPPFRVEQANESWVIRTDHEEIPVHSVLEGLLDRRELAMIGIDRIDPVEQIVSYLCTAGILKGQGAVNQLQISSSINDHLKQNSHDSRQQLEQAKDRVHSMVRGLQ